MKITFSALLIFFCLTGCVTAQEYSVLPPSISEVQGGCFVSREKFVDQTACIKNAIYSNSPDPYVQEYMAYMQLLEEKVKAKKISNNEARLELTQKLNSLREKQNAEFAQQEELVRQRDIQTYEILKQNAPKPFQLEMPRQSTKTNCQFFGSQMQCSTN